MPSTNFEQKSTLDSTIRKRKQEIREYIWKLMEEKNITRFPRPVFGRIPNFIGADKAAERLLELDVFKEAEVIFVNPDSPQKHVRYRVLLSGKKLVMATPRLRKGFWILDPERIPRAKYNLASTIKGASIFGKTTSNLDNYHIDLKVAGSVAVTKDGARVGKGGGYSDLEFGILTQYGWISDETQIVTTVHDIQIVKSIPMTKHDVPIDIVATPTQTIFTNHKYERPKGIYWDELDSHYLREIPILERLAKEKKITKK